MKLYNQFCPLAQASQILSERWTLLIIREFIAGSTRFSDIEKGVPTMSPSLLSTRLKSLVEAGILENVQKGMYRLTPAGQELRPIIELMGAWGHRWVRSNLEEKDLDAGLLMWDMRRSINPAVFPERRIVVQFIYPDAAKGQRAWWLISENKEVDLCLDDPGHEVDVVIESSLAAMTAVWTCQMKLNDAVISGAIKVNGDQTLKNKLQDWLRSSLLSRLGTIEKFPKVIWDID